MHVHDCLNTSEYSSNHTKNIQRCAKLSLYCTMEYCHVYYVEKGDLRHLRITPFQILEASMTISS